MGLTGQRAARLVCVLAVLIGLFGMHGLATAQADGCHGSPVMSSAVPSATVSMAPTPADKAGVTVETLSVTRGMADTLADGCCLFVAPSAWPALVLVLLAILTATTASAVGGRRAAGGGGRAPPRRSGVSLLRWVCVSLT